MSRAARAAAFAAASAARADGPPLLTPAEEQALAAVVQAAAPLRGRVGPPTRDEAAALAAADAAVAELVRRNERLAWSVALRLRLKFSRVDAEELFGYARLGLFRAARKYEPGRGRFSTYATWWCAQSVFKEAANAAGPIRIPADPDPELARRARRAGSLDAPVAPGATVTLGATLADAGSPSPWADLVAAGEHAEVARAIGRLPERYAAVLRLRFAEGLTLEDAGVELGVTRERVRQIEVAALARVREILGVPAPAKPERPPRAAAPEGAGRPPGRPPARGYNRCPGGRRFHVRVVVDGRALCAGLAGDEATAARAAAILRRAAEPGADAEALVAEARAVTAASRPARRTPLGDPTRVRGRAGGRVAVIGPAVAAYDAAWTGDRTPAGRPRSGHPGVVWKPGSGWVVQVTRDNRTRARGCFGVDLDAARAAAAAERALLPPRATRRCLQLRPYRPPAPAPASPPSPPPPPPPPPASPPPMPGPTPVLLPIATTAPVPVPAPAPTPPEPAPPPGERAPRAAIAAVEAATRAVRTALAACRDAARAAGAAAAEARCARALSALDGDDRRG